MLKSLAVISLKSKIEKDNQSKQKRFLPWDKIEKIAIIIQKNERINKSAIDKFVEDTKKYVEVFYVELNSKQATFSDWQCFSKKDSSLLKLPKKNIIAELKKKKFDVVINTSEENDLFSIALSSSFPSLIQCDPTGKFNNVNLIIKKMEPFNLITYLNEVIKYLKMIKT